MRMRRDEFWGEIMQFVEKLADDYEICYIEDDGWELNSSREPLLYFLGGESVHFENKDTKKDIYIEEGTQVDRPT